MYSTLNIVNDIEMPPCIYVRLTAKAVGTKTSGNVFTELEIMSCFCVLSIIDCVKSNLFEKWIINCITP